MSQNENGGAPMITHPAAENPIHVPIQLYPDAGGDPLRPQMTGDYIDNGLLPLCDRDRKALEVRSGIASDVISERGYFTAQTRTQLLQLGFSEAQARNVPALVLPLYRPSGEVTYQIRPHTAPVINGKETKYLLARGQSQIVDVHPRIRGLIKDPNTDLFVTEGCKKADCAISRGLCCINLTGVYGWRNQNGPLADWEEIRLADRRVFLAFDSDAMSKYGVWNALRRLKCWLEGRHAIVKVVYFPEGGEDHE